ncbi:MAG: hypothetical protein KGN39_01755 [Betaproteobacteria bacterium]|nr:hypothetical protein [Betaproteobacteria bacterium]
MTTIDYSPAPIVGEFIQHYLPNQLFYAFIVGPFGSAKTTGSLFKIPYMAKMQTPSPIDGIRRTRVVVVRNTAPQLADTTLKSWNIWFKDGTAGKWLATPKTFILKFDDVECEVLFRALDTAEDVSKVLSLEVTFAVLDEFVQIKQEIVEGLSGRCGRYPPKVEGGATNFGMWGASNPGEEGTYWHEFLIENKPDNCEYYHQPSGLSPHAENLENLPPGYYANLAQGKSPAWIKQFIEAHWGYSVAGKPVVPTFNRELHISKVPLKADINVPLVIGYDPGVRHSALILGQEDMFGRLHILDEVIMEGYGAERMITDQLMPLLKRKYDGFEVIIAPDPAANSRTPTNETTVADILRSRKYRDRWDVVIDTNNLLGPRLDAIEHYTCRLTAKGPALVVDPGCKKLIQALQGGWRYTETQKGVDKAEPDKNIHSHPGDAMTYLAKHFVNNVVRRKKRQLQTALPRFTNTYVLR